MVGSVKTRWLMAAIGASAMVAISAPAIAGAPAPASVKELVAQIRSAIRKAELNFTPLESASDKETDVQNAIASIVTNGADPLVAQAALNQLSGGTSTGSPVGEAVAVLLQTIAPAAAQESLQPTSTGPTATTNTQRSAVSYASITAGGAANGSGGGGGYISGH